MKKRTWLLAPAVISVLTLCTICNPQRVPSFAAQTVKISKPLRRTAVTDTEKGAAAIHRVPTAQHHAKTSKSGKGFMVPPPPPTPCVLPPEFGFFLAQPGQQQAAPEQQLQQAQEQASPKTPNQTAAQDQELEAADQELQAALRSSLRTVGEWTH